MRSLVLAAAGMFFAGMGIYALAVPAALAKPFRLTVDTAVSRSEIRAVYGGFGLAMAALLGWSASGTDDLRSGAAITVGVALAGMAAGRVLSRLADSATSFYPIWFYCLVEAVGAAAVLAVA
ncbi:DUF4345 family protein [Nocardia mexicana]|uniref:Uncharacterized protein DUF4345 n=1 Tax=Nocardia mexicana TaxID=279262 RepID=A0A370H282_9NOCA|nr:DUF4345 family protein [Nocardia mexicana]RDI49147.1 uncharacterized protein DUF4345 [Nocardia mexicana]